MGVKKWVVAEFGAGRPRQGVEEVLGDVGTDAGLGRGETGSAGPSGGHCHQAGQTGRPETTAKAATIGRSCVAGRIS